MIQKCNLMQKWIWFKNSIWYKFQFILDSQFNWIQKFKWINTLIIDPKVILIQKFYLIIFSIWSKFKVDPVDPKIPQKKKTLHFSDFALLRLFTSATLYYLRLCISAILYFFNFALLRLCTLVALYFCDFAIWRDYALPWLCI